MASEKLGLYISASLKFVFRELDLTSLSLKLSVPRKATRCIDLKTLAQRGEKDEIDV